MTTANIDRISALKTELAALKQERKQKVKAAKAEGQWINFKRRVPEVNRVLVWTSDEQIERCWHANGQFYLYDGTWLYTEKERLDNVSHWMPRDWMVSREWPAYGPGIKNRLVYLWRRLTQGAQSMAHDLRPKGWSTTAQLNKKPSFFVNRSTGEVMTGGPEHVNAPRGYEKVVCTSASEAERWSSRQRDWDRSKHDRLQEQRAAIEEPIHKEIRSEMHQRMANARNATNREFMRRAIERAEGRQAPYRYERESYLHAEGHESGH